MRTYVDESTCIACGQCQEVCPAEPNCYEILDVATVIHPESCTACNACVETCPVSCIELKDA